MDSPDPPVPQLTAKDVAALFRVHPRSVSRWALQGLLPFLRTPSGRYRFREETVRRLLRTAEPTPGNE
ncbi:hypothetical protein SUDANB121_02914 [Nocardiopsis dassonvillei]|uniref:helix-turn-helix domain-containing protein n=1 Tax=Nocardiopsis dassonvillei TaxID=2014 RepID=UPI003F57D2CD